MKNTLYTKQLAAINARLTPEVVAEINERGRLLVAALASSATDTPARHQISEARRDEINATGQRLERAFLG